MSQIRVLLLERTGYYQAVLCRPELEDGTFRVDLAPLVRALGLVVDTQGMDDGYVVLRPARRRRPRPRTSG